MKKWFLLSVATLCAPIIASAHEVYVLTPEEIREGISTPAFSELDVAFSNVDQFMFWTFVGLLLVSTVFFISLWHWFEDRTAPLFAKIRPYAPAVARIALSVSLLAGAYYDALFGPELPLSGSFGTWAVFVRIALVVIGLMMLFDLYTWIAAGGMLVLFALEVLVHQSYMLTYVNYLGDAVALILLSGTALTRHLKQYSMLVLRVCFGVGLIYSSFYAKILHNNLALQVAELPLAGHPYGVAHYLGFEPHFLVLGAAIIEIVIGLFFIIGMEIRWTALFMLFWLTLSVLYFGESVWPHFILIGIGIAFFCHGYDRYSIEWPLLKRFGHKPIA
ncbi:DoxX family membrane protein [Patescibacteria group bacterium]|nr:DoxX family membrane protein [Patescibacteria group bacterium]